MRKTKLISLILAAIMAISLFAGCSGNSATEAVAQATATETTTTLAETTKVVTTTITEPIETEAVEKAGDAGGFEEGVSESDSIVNTTAAEKVLLVVSFGSSYNQTRDLNIGAIETRLIEAYPDYQVRRAFTSQIIIDKLAKREGLKIDNVTQAMDRLVLDGVKDLIIQPTTVMNGFEYDDVIEEVSPYADKFESFKIGKWLLADDDDFEKVAELIVGATEQQRSEDTAIVLMGHGTEHDAGAIYSKLQSVFNDKNYSDYIIGTVEHSIGLDYVQKKLSELKVKNVILRPLMIVAGDHANNDMASDEEDSWKTILSTAGYNVETVIEGLGEIKGIRDLFVDHVKDAKDSKSISAEPTAPATGLTANRIKDGTFAIEVDSDSSMFKIVDCQLTVENGAMSAVMTLSGQGYSKLYMGSAEEAAADEANAFDFVVNEERHAFTIPVEALNEEIACAAQSAKKGTWYDHVIVFESSQIPNDAYLEKTVEVEMTGGTGRSSIGTPVKLSHKDGRDLAEIKWSSPNYTYMLVDDEKYLPVNTEGNSIFEIPVVLDKEMEVIGNTVAMSTPKEVAYVLRFDSATIK